MLLVYVCYHMTVYDIYTFSTIASGMQNDINLTVKHYIGIAEWRSGSVLCP